MKKVMLICAPVSSRSGYGDHARDLVRAFLKLDKFNVKIWDVPWGQTPKKCVVFLGYMLVNLIRSQREQSDDLEEIKTSISKQETELTSTYQICVKLIDSVNGFKQSTNDKMDRRHESLMKGSMILVIK